MSANACAIRQWCALSNSVARRPFSSTHDAVRGMMTQGLSSSYRAQRRCYAAGVVCAGGGYQSGKLVSDMFLGQSWRDAVGIATPSECVSMLQVFDASTKASAPPPLFVATLLHRCLVTATAAGTTTTGTTQQVTAELKDILLSVQNPEECLSELCRQWRFAARARSTADGEGDLLNVKALSPAGIPAVLRELFPSMMASLAARAHDALMQVLVELVIHAKEGGDPLDDIAMHVYREALQRSHSSNASLRVLFGPLARMVKQFEQIVEVSNLVDTVREVSHAMYFDLDDLVTLILSASNCRNFDQTILQWWSWLQYTRAAVDPKVLSIIMEIQCTMNHYKDAPETHHKILTQGAAPSYRAQAAYLRMLSRRPILSIAYAEHVVARWEALMVTRRGADFPRDDATGQYRVLTECMRLYRNDIAVRGRTDSLAKMLALMENLVDPTSPWRSLLSPAVLTFVLRTTLGEVYRQRRLPQQQGVDGSDAVTAEVSQVEKVIANALHIAFTHRTPSDVGGEDLAVQMILAADAVDMLEVVGEWLQRGVSDESFEKILRDVMGRSEGHIVALEQKQCDEVGGAEGSKRQSDKGKRRELLLQAVCETANREMPDTMIAWLQLLDGEQLPNGAELTSQHSKDELDVDG